jgi:hypothetical protein
MTSAMFSLLALNAAGPELQSIALVPARMVVLARFVSEPTIPQGP